MVITWRERFDRDMLRLVEPLARRNWDETGGYADLDYDVDWDMYMQMERMGVLYCFVARDDETDEVVAFSFYFRSPGHPHDKKVGYAIQDTFYVVPEYRKRGVGLTMLSFVEQYLMNEGVGVITQAAKPDSNFDKVLRAKGYEHTENMFLKRL
jgi:GNAT superfamily N-acetyltransferase